MWGKLGVLNTPMEKIIADYDRLRNRAFAAYFRSARRSNPLAISPEMPSDTSGVDEINGKLYVILRSASCVLAAYRVRNDSQLKRLIRCPKELLAIHSIQEGTQQ